MCTVGTDKTEKRNAQLTSCARARTNPRLIGLRNISKDAVDHPDEHPVLVWVPGVFNDRDHVCSFLSHVNEVTARSNRSKGLGPSRLLPPSTCVQSEPVARGPELRHTQLVPTSPRLYPARTMHGSVWQRIGAARCVYLLGRPFRP